MEFGRLVLVPIINPASADPLLRLAGHLAGPDRGTVVPVTVVSPEAGSSERAAAEELVRRCESTAATADVTARGVVAERAGVADAVLATAADQKATLVVMGWQGRSTQRNVFGEIIDSIVGRSATPLVVARLQDHAYDRILFAVGADNLAPAGIGGVRLAAACTRRLADAGDLPIRVVRSGPGEPPLPDEVAHLSDRVHHDPRRHDLAVGAAASAQDLIVVPVAPTTSGLRSATTHIAWAAPDASIAVVIDVGPAPTPGLAEAVSEAGTPPARPEAPPEDEHHVLVTIRTALDARPPERSVTEALAAVGEVGGTLVWRDGEGRWSVQAEVTVRAAGSNQALARIMTALHNAEGFDGAEIRYDLT